MANTEINPFAYNPAVDTSVFGTSSSQEVPEELDISQYLPARAPQAQAIQGKDSSYNKAFQQAESQYRLPSGLLSTMGFHESGFNPEAKSSAGAKGLMQFMPATANEYGINARDPYASIDAAGKKMSGLVKYYNGDIAKAVAAYNFGEGNLNRAIKKAGENWLSAVPPETKSYVSKVLGDKAQAPQGPQEDTYPIPLASGRTLYAPKGMPREEALASARAQGVDAVGLRDIPLASGKTLQVPEHLSDEEAIKQASEAHPDIDFTIAESETPSRTVPQAVKDIGVGTMKGGVGLGQSLVGLVDILTPGQFGKSLEEHGINLEKAQQYLDTQYSPQQQEAINNLAQAHGFRNIIQAAVENPTAVISMAGESLPQVIGGGVVGAGAKLAGLGRFVAAGLGQGSMTAGSTGEAVRTASPERELTTKGQVAALGAGAVEAALGKYGSEFVTKIGGIDPSLLIMGEAKKLAVDTVGEVAENPKFFSTVLKSLVGEGVEEIPQEAQAQMFQNYATDKPLLEGVEDAATKGLITGAVTGAGAGTVGAIAAQPSPEEAVSEPPALQEPSITAETTAPIEPTAETTSPIEPTAETTPPIEPTAEATTPIEPTAEATPAEIAPETGAPQEEEEVPLPGALAAKTRAAREELDALRAAQTDTGEAVQQEAVQEEPKVRGQWVKDIFGVKESSGIFKKLKDLDIDNPADHPAIDAQLDTLKTIKAPQYEAITQRMDAAKATQPEIQPQVQQPEGVQPSANEVPEATTPDVSSSAQPEILQEGEGAPISSEGVREGRPETGQVEEEKVEPVVSPKVVTTDIERPSDFKKEHYERALAEGNYTEHKTKKGDIVKLVNLQDKYNQSGVIKAFDENNNPIGFLDYANIKQEGSTPGVYDVIPNPDVGVDWDWHRQGIATAMYDLAEETGGLIPSYETPAVRTELGGAFRKSRELAKLGTPRTSIEANRDTLKDRITHLEESLGYEKDLPDYLRWSESRLASVNKEIEALKKAASLPTPPSLTKFVESFQEQNPEYESLSNQEAVVSKAIDRTIKKEKAEELKVFDTPEKKIQLFAARKKAHALLEAGKISPDEFIRRSEQITDEERVRHAEAAFKRNPRARGANYVREKLLNALRKGDVSQEGHDFAEWFIKKNPDALDNLGISIKTAPEGKEETAGNYTPLNQVITLFKGHRKDTTAVHEILHHLERAMPEQIQKGIRRAWLKQTVDAREKAIKNKADKSVIDYYDAVLLGEPKAARDALMKVKEGRNEIYHHLNASEFWAVNATDIMQGKYGAEASFIAKLKQWLKEAHEHIKHALGLNSNAPVLKAIDHVLKNIDTDYAAKKMLAERNKGIIYAAPPSGPSESNKDLGKKLADSGLVKTSDKSIVDSVKEGFNNFKGSSISKEYSKIQTSFVDSSAGLRRALSDLDTFDMNGKLRADMLHSKFDQIYNIIRESFNSGPVVLSSDGGVMASENKQLALRDIFKRIDSLKFDDPRGTFFTVMRVLAGEENLRKDVVNRGIANDAIEAANNLDTFAKDVSNKVKYGQLKAQSAALRKEAKKILDRVGVAPEVDGIRLGTEKLVTKEHIDQARSLLDKNPEVAPIMADIYSLLRASVDLWEKTGLVNNEVANEWRSNPSYIPLYKSMDDLYDDPNEYIKVLKSGPKSIKEVKRLEGGTHAVNVGENLVKHITFMTGAAAQNQLRKAAVSNLSMVDDTVKRTHPDDKQAVMFKVDGNKVYYHIDDPMVLEALETAMPSLSGWAKFTQPYTKVFRTATLVNPLYWYRQVIRDPLHANLVSQTGIVHPGQAIVAFAQILAGEAGLKSKTFKDYEALKRQGVVGAVDALTDPKQFIKAMALKPGVLKKSGAWVMRIHEAADAATRVIVYEAGLKEAKQRGLSGQKAQNFATMRAREIINFAKKGNAEAIANIRATVPFFSSALNSMDTIVRAATGMGLNKKEAARARKMFATRALVLASVSAAWALHLQDDEDYIKSPDWVNSWLIPTGLKDSPFWKLPIPFEAGFFFKVLPELMVRLVSGTLTPKEARGEAGKAAMQLLVPPVPFAQIFKPALEVVGNYDTFTKRPIESVADLSKTKEQRDSKASDLAKFVSKATPLSPNQIEHLGKGYLTELWAVTALLAENFLHEGPAKPEKYLGEMPIIKGVLTKPEQDKTVNQFYEIEKAAAEISNTIKGARKTGEKKVYEEMMADPEKAKLFRAYPSLNNTSDRISKLRKNIERIKNDPATTPAEKTKRIRGVQQQINKAAEQGMATAKRLKLDI